VTASLVPTVTLELGGHPRAFRLDMNALCRYEREMAINALKAETWEKFERNEVTAVELRALLWACLVQGDGEALTPEDIGQWLTPTNMAEVATALAGLRSGSVPEVKEDAPEVAGEQSPFGGT
jgi:hypothetical protein